LNRGTEDNSYSARTLGEKNNIAHAKHKERTLKKTLGTELRRRTLLHPPQIRNVKRRRSCARRGLDDKLKGKKQEMTPKKYTEIQWKKRWWLRQA
jgi:hypothetical protein